MRIVISINDLPREFDRCSLSLVSPDFDYGLFVTIAPGMAGTWSVVSHDGIYPLNSSRFKRAPVVTVDVKP